MTRTCIAEGCDNPAKTRGLCWPHYQNWWKKTRKPTKPTRPCTIEGCDKPLRSKGMCSTHYNRSLPPGKRHNLNAKPQVSRKGEPVVEPLRTWIAGRCHGCNAWYLAKPGGRSGTRWCSGVCERRFNHMTRKARLQEAEGTFTRMEFAALITLLGGCCAYCGVETSSPEPDHIVPLSRGGSNDIGNIAPACADCNRAKHANTVERWSARRVAAGLAPRRLDPRLAGRSA